VCECSLPPAEREAYLSRYKRFDHRKFSEMQANNRFIEEAKRCAEAWKKTGVLDGLSDRDQLVAGIMLESQRLTEDHEAFLSRIRSANWIASRVISTSSPRPADAVLERGPRYGEERDWGAVREEVEFVLDLLGNRPWVPLGEFETGWARRGFTPPAIEAGWAGDRKLDRLRWLESRRVYEAINILLDYGYVQKAVRRAEEVNADVPRPVGP